MRTPQPLTPARVTALVIFTTAMLSLRAQFDVSQGLMGNPPALDTLWRIAGYFTVLTNFLIAIVMAAIAWNWQISARLAAALVVSIVLVSITYHLLLAGLWNPQGIAWWANQGLHTAVPVMTVGWWLAFAPKDIRYADIPRWLIWPALYGLYALTRGAITGFWPYPFLDAGALGWPMVAGNLLGLLVIMAALGAGLVTLAKRLP